MALSSAFDRWLRRAVEAKPSSAPSVALRVDLASPFIYFVCSRIVSESPPTSRCQLSGLAAASAQATCCDATSESAGGRAQLADGSSRNVGRAGQQRRARRQANRRLSCSLRSRSLASFQSDLWPRHSPTVPPPGQTAVRSASEYPKSSTRVTRPWRRSVACCCAAAW